MRTQPMLSPGVTSPRKKLSRPTEAQRLRRRILTAVATASVVLPTITWGAVPPTIVAAPADVTVVEGQSATFSVVADGTAPLSYQWQLNESDIPGAMAESYTLASANLADDGDRYAVQVSNAFGSVLSGEAVLSVNPSVPLIPKPTNPRWFQFADGRPFFMCGPGDPEDFLYRGTLNPDGTRSGDQMALIAKMTGTGANSIYFQIIRSHGGDGDSTHNPFVGSDPSLGLDQDILDQWETWFTAMDNAGIAIFLFFFDDSATIWGSGDPVPPEEIDFLQQIVDRFEHHNTLVWAVAEEYSEAFSSARISNMAAVIRAADDFGHPIAVHKQTGLSFVEFADDPNIDQFAVQFYQTPPESLHTNMVTAFQDATGRYNLNMAESEGHGAGSLARQKNWAVAMSGAYVMVLGWDIASTDINDLRDCGGLVRFMEGTDFFDMEPRDDLALGGTQYALANAPDSYILYASSLTGEIGVRGIASGTYDFRWYDILSDTYFDQFGIAVPGGDVTWPSPAGVGTELAVWVQSSGPPPTPQVEQYHVHEQSVTSTNSYANSFIDVTLAVTVTSPSGPAQTFEGFFDGDGVGGQSGIVWKFRYMPTETGTHSFSTSSNDPQLDGQSGSFDCVVSTSSNQFEKSGHVVIHPANPHAFAHHDGTGFFWNGDTEWFFLSDDISESDRNTAIDFLGNKDMNNLLMTMINADTLPVYPWPTTGDQLHMDLDKMRRWERAVERLLANDIMADLWFYSDDTPWRPAASSAEEDLLFRYVIARFGAYANVSWNLGLEYSEYRSAAWVDSQGQFVKDQDPYDHILSVHQVPGDTYDFPGDQNLDHTSLQSFTAGPDQLNSIVIANRSAVVGAGVAIPVCHEEFFIEGAGASSVTDGRQKAWAVATAGGCYKSASLGFWIGTPYTTGQHFDDAQILFNTFTGTNWWEMSPDNSLVSNGGSGRYCLANTTAVDPEYLVYSTSGSSFTIDLSAVAGQVSVNWTDPVTGASSSGTVVGGGVATFSNPFGSGESAVHVGGLPPPNQAPTAAVSATPISGDAPLPVTLDGSGSTDPDGTIVSYGWDFGDTQTGTGVTVNHIYTASGTYTVTLTVTDDDGATGTATTTITVTDPPPPNQAPTASVLATPTSGDAPLPVTLDGSGSTDPDGTIVSYGWDFGDTQTGSGVTVNHIYATSGTYTVALTVTDDDGATDTATTTVTVTDPPPPNQAPTASVLATPISGDAPLPVTLDGSGSTDPDGTIVSYGWDFGDTQTGSGVTVNHIYATSGAYTVTLTVTDDDGATGTATTTITVTGPPPPNQAPTAVASASPTSGDVPLPVTLDGSGSTDPDGTIVSYGWDFGDTQTGSGVTVNHIYTASGTYTVTLTVTDDDGATDTATTTVTVTDPPPPNQAPTAAVLATPTSGDAPLPVTLDGSGSTDPDGTIVSYGWDFGDTQTGSGVTVNHIYATSGTYTVALTVTDDDGATDTATTTVTVTDPPPPNQAPTAAVSASPTSGDAPLPVTLDGSGSTDPDGTIVSYGWDFGDTQTGTGVTTNHIYTASGTYTVTLTVTDDDGATDTATTTITVTDPPPPNQAPTASVLATPTSGDAPLPVTLDGSGSTDPDGTIVSYGWDFGDTQTGTGVTVNHIYGTSGTYTVTLTVTDDDGATDTATTTVTVNPATAYQVLVSFSSDRSSPINLEGVTVSGDIYVFTSPDAGVAATSSNRVHFYLDDPGQSGSPFRSERLAPFDFAGGSVSNAFPFDADGLTVGSHTITATLPLDTGATEVIHATFSVASAAKAVASSNQDIADAKSSVPTQFSLAACGESR